MSKTRKSNYKNTKSYKKWIKKVGEAALAPKNKAKHDDLCTSKTRKADGKKFCEGSIGIERKYMPQINIPKFTKTLKHKYKVPVQNKQIRPSELKPAQGEIRTSKVMEIVKSMKKGKKKNPNGKIVVSEDGYVVDGHHRWAASLIKAPDTPIPAIVIKAGITDSLGMAAAMGAETIAFG
jgi:hypothetical protein